MVHVPYTESLSALSLIGSHFGVPGNASFDYIVVGGGTAGLALADRLATGSSYSVAVIEGGAFSEIENGNLSSIAAFAPNGVGSDPKTFNRAVDWGQYTGPEAALGGRTIFYPSGKTLGGGSVRNYQVYQRGTVGAHERWADEVGDRSYEFSRFLPFYEKSVSLTPPDNSIRPRNSSATYDPSVFDPSGGPLKVSFADTWVPAMDSWMQAAFRSVGIYPTKSTSSGSLMGSNYVPVTQDAVLQTRSSSETSFLRQALANTSNLAVFTHTLAKKITFDANKKATGVDVESNGMAFHLTAAKEVIVSAGTFRSPQLLMASGVGPAATLNKLSIPVVADRRGVGQNLWDHMLFGPSRQVSLPTHSVLRTPANAAKAAEQFIANRSGILTNNAGILAWEKLPAHLKKNLSPKTRQDLDSQFPKDWPDVELLYIDAWLGDQKDSLTDAPDNKTYGSLAMALVAPFSRGNVTISSRDTATLPTVHLNFLQDQRDQEVAVQMMRRAREIFAAPNLKPVLVGGEVYPGANYSTDAQLLQVIRQSAYSVHHASGTCKMGRSSDPLAVVDNRARVMGVSGLRVVDASSLPFLIPGHPQGVIYALAEKIAADILGR